MAGTDPVVGFPSGINLLDDLRIVPLVAEFREEDPFRTEGDVDGEDLPLLEGVVQEEGDQLSNDPRSRGKIVLPLSVLDGRDREGGNPQERRLEGPCHGSRIDRVLTEVGSEVDPGDDEVRALGKKGLDSQVGAVGRGSGDGKVPLVEAVDPERLLNRQGEGDGALFGIRSDDIEVSQPGEGLLQSFQPRRED